MEEIIVKQGNWKVIKEKDCLCEMCFRKADYTIEYGEGETLVLTLCKDCLYHIGCLAQEIK